MTRRVDVAVIGVGGIGSATLYHAARQGLASIGFEQFVIGHDRGSSHGESRIIRLAYFEDPAYVPLARRAFAGWTALESLTGRSVMVPSGGLDLGPPDGRLVPGALRSCELHGLPFELWNAAELRRRAPGLRFPEHIEAIYQPDAAILRPEAGVRAHVQAARQAGASIQERSRLLDWETEGDGVRLRVGMGAGDGGTVEREVEFYASRLILTTGAWMGGHLEAFGGGGAEQNVGRRSERPERIVRPERQVVGWLPGPAGAPTVGLPSTGTFPVVNAELDEGHVYFMPPFDGRGIKVGLYHHRREQVVDPDQRDAPPDDDDRMLLQSLADRYLSTTAGSTGATTGDGAASAKIGRMRSCRFNLSPDEHFLIDTIAEGRVVIGGGFSGHGYKFAPALGEVLVALARGDAPPVAIDPFSLGRFRTDA